MDMIEYIIVGLVGLIVGWHTSRHVHLQGFRDLLRAMQITEQQLRDAVRKIASPEWQQLEDAPEDLNVVEVRLEEVGGEIFAYRKDNHQFLGQGCNPQGLIERLNQNLTPCRVIVADEDGAALLQKNNT